MTIFLWNGVGAFRFPRVDGDWCEALILGFPIFASVLNNLIPRMLDRLIFLAELS